MYIFNYFHTGLERIACIGFEKIWSLQAKINNVSFLMHMVNVFDQLKLDFEKEVCCNFRIPLISSTVSVVLNHLN